MSAASLALALVVTQAHAGEVTLWHAWRGEERAAIDQLAATWTAAHPDTPLVPIFTPYDALSSKLEAAVPRGNGPDLFVYAHEKARDWQERGVILTVEPVPGVLDVADRALGDGEASSRLGWPLAVKSQALYRDRRKVSEAPATTDALLASARAHTGGGSWGLVTELSSPYAAASWMHGFGGGVMDGSLVRFERPGNVAAFGFLAQLREVVPPDISGATVVQYARTGKAAMAIAGPSLLGELADAGVGAEWAVSPLPIVTPTGQPAAPWATVETVFLAREGADARRVGAWLASAETVAVRRDVARHVVAQADASYADPDLAAFRAQGEAAVAMPTEPVFAQHWEPLGRALRRLVRGEVTPEAAAQEAATAFAIVTRPAAAPVAWQPWAAVLAVGSLGGLAWAARGIGRSRADIARWRHAYAWVAPALVAVLALVVVPFVTGATVSFFETDGRSFSFVGLTHFLDIVLARDWPLDSPLSFWTTLAVTLLWTTVNLVLHVSLGVGLAWLLREPWVRLRGLFRALLILPWAIPSYLTALTWKGMFHREMGAINAILEALGAAPLSWFGKFSTAFAANVTTNTWLGFPFMMVITLGALQAIPRELEEAAALDGASGWQRFRHVVLPQLAPALVPAIVIGSVWTFNAFNVIYLVSGGEPDGATDILVSQSYRWAFTRGHRYGYAAAYAVLIFGVLTVYGRAARRLTSRVEGA